MVNSYSDSWYEIFLSRGQDSQTRKEVEFILSQIQVGIDQKILDVGCGNGRHARMLAAHGFEITGIDINERMIREASQVVPEGEFLLLDMRDLDSLKDREFDVVLIMWQSFGYFDDEVNKNILRNIYSLLKSSGKLILDIYNKEFFQNNQGIRIINRDNKKIEETKFVKNDRLEVNLNYGRNIDPDNFNWRIYSVEEFISISKDIGFDVINICSNFDVDEKVTSDDSRVQYVLKK